MIGAFYHLDYVRVRNGSHAGKIGTVACLLDPDDLHPYRRVVVSFAGSCPITYRPEDLDLANGARVMSTFAPHHYTLDLPHRGDVTKAQARALRERLRIAWELALRSCAETREAIASFRMTTDDVLTDMKLLDDAASHIRDLETEAHAALADLAVLEARDA